METKTVSFKVLGSVKACSRDSASSITGDWCEDPVARIIGIHACNASFQTSNSLQSQFICANQGTHGTVLALVLV